MIQPVEKIWLDGKLVSWERANVHLLTHSLHYGLAVFEGIRCYKSSDGRRAVFRLDEHVRRLFNSGKITTISIPYTPHEIANAIVETLRANNLPEAYIRPIAFIGQGAMGLYALDNPIRVAVIVYHWGAYLGEDALKSGIRAKISSFNRHHVNAAMSKAKICGNYVNSILAKREAVLAGYQEAIMLDPSGYVAEASGENIFVCQDGCLVTPPLSSPVLPGITRDTVIQLARDRGMEVVERTLARDELYIADEVFLTGTAAEITPVREVDGRVVGDGRPGPIVQELQRAFFAAVRGDDPRHVGWLSYV